MATKFQTNVKNSIDYSTGAFADKVICHKDGTVTLKRYYFYRHGMTANIWANQVSKVLIDAQIAFRIIEWRDDCKIWPTDSHFTVVVGPA